MFRIGTLGKNKNFDRLGCNEKSYEVPKKVVRLITLIQYHL